MGTESSTVWHKADSLSALTSRASYALRSGLFSSHPVKNRRCRHLTDLVARRSPLQQQTEAVAGLLVVLQALTQPTIVILHQSPVHNHFKLA